MGWTYTGNPQDSDRDLVRFLLGDRTQTDQSLSDEELDYLITEHTVQGTVYPYRAASEAAGIIANRYIGMSSSMKKVGDLTLETHYAEQAGAFSALAERLLRGRTGYAVGAPQFFDTTASVFRIGQMDGQGNDPRLR